MLPLKSHIMQTRGKGHGHGDKICLLSLCCLFSFLLGLQIGISSAVASRPSESVLFPSSFLCGPCPNGPDTAKNNHDQSTKTSSFPSASLRRVVYDYATTPRDDFFHNFDLGVPMDNTVDGAEDVLILYNSNRSLPYAMRKAEERGYHHIESSIEATEHCQSMKVVLVDPSSLQRVHKNAAQCMAIVPQWSSPYIYKFMRLPDDQGDRHGRGRINDDLPLRYVSRTHEDSGRHHAAVPPLDKHTLRSLAVLSEYIQELPHAQKRLQALLKNADTQDPLIVMTCNKGQSELFMNFVCSVTARKLPLDRVILFATDEYTYTLCQELQVQYCYHDPTLFGDIPEEAAEWFGDDTFAKVMKAKVYSVHLILTLGYSVLFSDVDVVWYKNPLDYYRTTMMEGPWDLVFQNDGARTLRYAPYSPNSGFYFVRHNPKTVFLFGELLKMGDTLSFYHSHQHALSQVLNEHISWTGLRVKVHPTGFDNPFPGGFEFNQHYPYMKDLLGNKETQQDPYIFHICWTESKIYKRKFLQQMRQWYVRDEYEIGRCNGYDCCVREPIVSCHFRDVPSVIPCKDSPPLDEEDPGDSFW
jgi:hypothetical protein